MENKSYLDHLGDEQNYQDITDEELALQLSISLNQPINNINYGSSSSAPSFQQDFISDSSSQQNLTITPSSSQQDFIYTPSSSQQNFTSQSQKNRKIVVPSYRESSPTFSVSTTSSLVRQFKGKATINELKKKIDAHNFQNKETIKSLIKNENKKNIEDPDEIIIETEIPWSGNEMDFNNLKTIPSWSFKYAYGIRIGEVIYCTINRRDKLGCHKEFTSKGKSSSTFTRHLESKHKLTPEISKYIFS